MLSVGENGDNFMARSSGFETLLIDAQELTPREAEVLCLVCSAHSNKSIAQQLAISINTVIHHIDSIRHKLGVEQSALNARLSLLRVAVLRGMVRIGCVLLVCQAAAMDDGALRLRAPVLRAAAGARRVDRCVS